MFHNKANYNVSHKTEIQCVSLEISLRSSICVKYMYIKPRPLCMRFKDFILWIRASIISLPNMKENEQTVVEIWAFPDFYIKPRLLINMHDIITKTNRAHLRTISYLCTTYHINPMWSSGDFVFTSSIWQNHIEPHPLRILMRFNVFIPWACGH